MINTKHLSTLLTGFVILMIQCWMIKSATVCVPFGQISCPYRRSISIISVTYCTQDDCTISTSNNPVESCQTQGGMSSNFMTEMCNNKIKCQFNVLHCEYYSKFYLSARIDYQCKAGRRPWNKTKCIRFGHIDCNNLIINIRKVNYYKNNDCSWGQTDTSSCQHDVHAVTKNYMGEKCNGLHTCNFAISRCSTATTSWPYDAAKIHYDCLYYSSTSHITNTEFRSTEKTMQTETTATASHQGGAELKDDEDTPLGPILGGVGGGLFLTILAIVMVVIFIKRRKQKNPPCKENGNNSKRQFKPETSECKDTAPAYCNLNSIGHERADNQNNNYLSLTDATTGKHSSEVVGKPPIYKKCVSPARGLMDNTSNDGLTLPAQNGNAVSYVVLEKDQDPSVAFTKFHLKKPGNTENQSGQSLQNNSEHYTLANNDENVQVYENLNDVTTAKHFSEVVGKPPKDRKLMSPHHGLTDNISNDGETLPAQNDDTANYFLLEKDQDRTVASGQSLQGNDDDYTLANTNENLEIYEYEKDRCADEHIKAEEYDVDPSETDVNQDMYGYSHMPELQRHNPIRDSTYDHTLSIENDEDKYGYAHARNGIQNGKRLRNPRQRTARSVDSAYVMRANQHDTDYDTLTNI